MEAQKAIRETPPRPVHPPARMLDTRPTNTGVQWREATRDSNEEEGQGLSKPGVLVSVQPNNSTTQPPALPEESPRSSMRTSRLAIDPSSDYSPHNESRPSRQRNEAHPSRNNEKTTDHRQELSEEPSNSSAFSVRGDPLMIGQSPMQSIVYENKEPEEHGFLDRSQAAERSTAEEPRDYLSDNNAAYTFSPSRNVPSECDDADSIDDTRRYAFHYSDNASIARDDSQNPGSSPNTIPLDGASSQRNGGNDDRNNNAVFPHMVIPAIAFALVGILVLYRSR